MIYNDEKITIDTELDTWFGETPRGDKVAITEVSFFEILSLMANSSNEKEKQIGTLLFEKAKTDNYIEMHDGTKLAKNIKSLLDNGMLEIANQLVQDAKFQNRKNGYLNTDPFDNNDDKSKIIG